MGVAELDYTKSSLYDSLIMILRRACYEHFPCEWFYFFKFLVGLIHFTGKVSAQTLQQKIRGHRTCLQVNNRLFWRAPGIY